MDKQKLIEKAVLHFGGKWSLRFKNLCTPAETNTFYRPYSRFLSIQNVSELGPNWIFICTEEEFNAAADRIRSKLWFEFGELPKSGESCEYKFQNPDVSWQPVQVNYISAKHAILTMLEDGNECHTDGFKAADFRPIRTDKEKAIDAAGAVIIKTSSAVDDLALNALYDAGFLRLPDEK
jgi:hypothetical protein